MSKKRKILTVIFSVLTLLTLAFIWGNSALSKDSSSEVSGGLFDKVKFIFDFVFGKDVITHHLFRKFAHVTEFAVLSVEINLIFVSSKGLKFRYAFISFLLAVIVASIDETIQIFSNRGPAVKDVLIDGIGNTVILIAFVIANIIKFKKQKSATK